MSRSFYIPHIACERKYYGPSTDTKNGSCLSDSENAAQSEQKSVFAAPTATAVPRGHQRRQILEITSAEKTSTRRSECL